MDPDVSLFGLALGGLLVCALTGALLRIVLPATRPYLEVLCDAPHRGRFWTRLLAVAMAGSVAIGAMAGHLATETLRHRSLPAELRQTWTVSAMLSAAAAGAAVVLGVLVVSTLLFESRNEPPDLR